MKQQEQIDQSAQAVAAVVAQSEHTAQQVLQHIGTADSSSTLATVPITTRYKILNLRCSVENQGHGHWIDTD